MILKRVRLSVDLVKECGDEGRQFAEKYPLQLLIKMLSELGHLAH